jgi:hypothetical protein
MKRRRHNQGYPFPAMVRMQTRSVLPDFMSRIIARKTRIRNLDHEIIGYWMADSWRDVSKDGKE